jgi:hypothetical protein
MALPRRRNVITNDRLQRVYAYSWWILCPALLVLVARFSYERGCLDPYELLQPLMRHQSIALIVAAIYTGAHLWMVTAGVLLVRTARAAGLSDTPPLMWPVDIKVVVMAVAIAVEQIPHAAWAWLYHAFGLC